jgi:hypothetical protein
MINLQTGNRLNNNYRGPLFIIVAALIKGDDRNRPTAWSNREHTTGDPYAAYSVVGRETCWRAMARGITDHPVRPIYQCMVTRK